jgi:cobalt-zinc-cadmium efflux system protein
MDNHPNVKHANSHGHSHDHGPHWVFVLGMVLNFSFFVADIIVWQISGSTAIFGDSIHNGFHGLAHASALWGHSLEGDTTNHTESLASLRRKNHAVLMIGILIILGALLIAIFGITQIINPQEIVGKYMILMASLDIVSNMVLLALLLSHRGDKTVRAVVLDISIDTLASIGVIIAGVVILFTQFYPADGIAAIPISLIALILAIKTIRRARGELKNISKNPLC